MAETTMTRTQMLDTLASGQSVIHKGKLITDPSHIPADLEVDQTPEVLPGTVPQSAVVVARELLAGITASVRETHLFTPKVSGLFRLNYYLGVVAAGTGGEVTLLVDFTDDVHEQSEIINGPALNTLAPVSGSYLFRAVAGQPISFEIDIMGAAGNPLMQAHLILEQLP